MHSRKTRERKEKPFQKYLSFFAKWQEHLVTDQGNVRKFILKCISWNYLIKKSLISAKYTIDGSAFPLLTCNTVNSIYEPIIPPYPHKKLWGQSWSEGAFGWPAERKETIIQEGAQRLGEPATQAYILSSLWHFFFSSISFSSHFFKVFFSPKHSI